MLRNKLHVHGDENLQVPFHINFGKELLNRIIEYGDHPALINSDNGEIMTFRELAQKTVSVALSLAHIGIRQGDTVAVCCEKRMEVMPTILGAICAGCVVVPTEITPFLHRLELSKPKVIFLSPETYSVHKLSLDSLSCIEKYIIYDNKNKDSGISFENFLTETADVTDFVPVAIDGQKDYVFILFSSGTTGLPKGAPWTHLGALVNSESCALDRYKYSSILITREWYLSYGLIITLSCLRKGTTCVFSVANEEKDCLRAIEKYKVKVIQSAPTAINHLIKSAILDQYDVTSVEMIMSSSMPVMKEQVEALKQRMPNLRGVFQIYGTTEAGNVCNEMYAPRGPREGSVGSPSHGFILKVVDLNTRQPLGPYQNGEICFKSPSLTPGYLGIANSDHLDSEGFYVSGDVGYYDDDGYFFVVNRVKELIKYKDYSISPAEVEAILCCESRVLEVAVAPVEGDIAALVVLQPRAHATTKELEEYFHSMAPSRMRLAGGIHFTDSLPRGVGEKLNRAAVQSKLEHIILRKS